MPMRSRMQASKLGDPVSPIVLGLLAGKFEFGILTISDRNVHSMGTHLHIQAMREV
ncbi:hypothetical protein M404DRAFT_997827 [Pisolithus tinctorius Marx 270]|uniref:Uncharacterized protein n=1 Tax=Pisolithus tinctorius Marx 270 TaxID=870435 RepID=A0A0C3PGZ9_PISTI|nr:hypothetical protein M404DRAFT_997827 [Pisolithus tinctorius Marx 270]